VARKVERRLMPALKSFAQNFSLFRRLPF